MVLAGHLVCVGFGDKNICLEASVISIQSVKSLPVEVLTRDEIERIIEEKIKKLATETPPTPQVDTEIKVEIADLKAQIAKMSGRIDELSAGLPAKAVTPLRIEDALRGELGGLAELLEIRGQPDQVTLRPRRYLGGEDFRSVLQAVRRHGGFWSSMNRTFVIRKAKG